MRNKVQATDYSEQDEDTKLILYNETVVQNITSVYLNRPIGDVTYYQEFIKLLQDMQEHDSLTIYIDGPGGDVDTTVSIIEAIENCIGNVHTVVTGRASSSHSILALMSPSLEVSPRARFFLHNASYGLGQSKHHEAKCLTDYYDKSLQALMKEAYSGFLTAQELQELYYGRDFYIDGEELQERLENRMYYLKNLQELEDFTIDGKTQN